MLLQCSVPSATLLVDRNGISLMTCHSGEPASLLMLPSTMARSQSQTEHWPLVKKIEHNSNRITDTDMYRSDEVNQVQNPFIYRTEMRKLIPVLKVARHITGGIWYPT